MKNWEKYLAKGYYSWTDMFLILIGENHMHNMLRQMMDDGMLGELNPDEFDDLVNYLEDKIRYV